MKVGYARVSTGEQNLDLQIRSLECICEKIFTDKVSGKTEQREGLQDALRFVRKGDVIVVWRLDRLARNLKSLIDITLSLEESGIGLISLTEQIDTSTPSGKLVFHLFASLAQFEADLIRQRTIAGLLAAKERGKIGGRPRALSDEQIKDVKHLYQTGVPVSKISKMLNVSKATCYRLVVQSC